MTQSYLVGGTDRFGDPLQYSFLGRLEQFEEDWRRLLKMLELPPVPLVHENGSGDKQLKAEVETAARADEPIVCSVCLAFMQDYVCFGYELPELCCSGRCSEHGVALPPAQLALACP